MGLLDDIERGATTSDEPLTDLLRRCKVLAARLKHAEFAAWVSRELNGYEKDEDAPPYRILHTPNSLGHFVGPFGRSAKNVPLPMLNVPAQFREGLQRTVFRQSIAQLQELGDSREGLERPWDANVTAFLQSRFMDGMHLAAAHVFIPPGAVTGLLDTVRTRVLDFVLAIKAENPEAGEAAPNGPPPIQPSTVTNVFNNTIVGGHANIGTTGNATIDNSDAYNTFALDATKAMDLSAKLTKARGEVDQLPKQDDKAVARSTMDEIENAAKSNKITPEAITKWTGALGGIVTTGTAAAPHIVDLVHWLGQLAASAGH